MLAFATLSVLLITAPGLPVPAPSQPFPTEAIASNEQTPAPPSLVGPVPPSVELAENTENGDIVITARKHVPGDPIEAANVESFKVVQAVNSVFVEPVTKGYDKVVPHPLRRGIHNVLDNLDEPIVFANFLLQLKPGKAARTLGRFAINSTAGLGGLFDVAKRKPFHMPRLSNGLADTLGFYGVKPGPYLFLPLIGSTTVRDMFGRLIDLSLVPAGVGKPFNRPLYATPHRVLSGLDEQSQNEPERKKLLGSADPYAVIRDHYLAVRAAEIDVLKGRRISVEDPRPPLKRHLSASSR